MQDGGHEEGDSLARDNGANAEVSDDEDNPWEPPVDHPGRKYERLAHRYDPDEAGDDASNSGPADSEMFEVPSVLQTRFWALVLVFNLALLGVSVGAMFAVFESDVVLGSQLFLAGAILFAYGLYRYRRVKGRLERGEFEDVGDQAGSESEDETVVDDNGGEGGAHCE